MINADITELHHVLRPICLLHLQRCGPVLTTMGWEPWLEETYRGDAGQLAAWLKGRNSAGEVVDAKAVVTNARPGASWHGVCDAQGRPASLAYHIRPKNATGVSGYGSCALDIDAYLAIGAIGEDLGLTWGFHFPSVDMGHYEGRFGYPDLAAAVAAVNAGTFGLGNFQPPVTA